MSGPVAILTLITAGLWQMGLPCIASGTSSSAPPRPQALHTTIFLELSVKFPTLFSAASAILPRAEQIRPNRPLYSYPHD